MPTQKRNAANRATLIRALEFAGRRKVTRIKTLRRATKFSAGVYLVTFKNLKRKRK